jgi:AcrR family transcriptional regulator
MAKTDRRVQRTRDLLQQTLIQLIDEHGYDAITVQEIVNRADVGRTTFYEHYRSKDDLFMSYHEGVVSEFKSNLLFPHPFSTEELLSPQTPPSLVSAYQHLEEARTQLKPIFQGKDGQLLLRRIRDQNAQEIDANLRTAFAESDNRVSFSLLATYLAGAQIALMQWWLEKR